MYKCCLAEESERHLILLSLMFIHIEVCVYVQTMHWQIIVVQHWTEFLILVIRWYCVMLNCFNVKL